MEWKSTDLRLDIDKTNVIIILRPSLQGGYGWDVGLGDVYTEDNWVIFTIFEDHKQINADEKWDDIWKWLYQPER